MAITIENNNLYPPVVLDINPAFIKTNICRVYFSLSAYNNAEDIKYVQISLVNQKTNQTALDFSTYPSGIKVVSFNNSLMDNTVQNDYKYFIEISPSDIQDGAFATNQFYIVQLRFASTLTSNLPAGSGINSWLAANQSHFSEWSSISLIRGIAQPHIYLNELNSSSSIILDHPLTEIAGRLYYETEDAQETEFLKSYNIIVYKNNLPVFKSDQIYVDQFITNKIDYEIEYNFQEEVNYILAFTYTTNDLYSQTINYQFSIEENEQNELIAIFNVTAENNKGRIKLDIDFNFQNYNITSNQNLIVKRSSSKNNFDTWETLKIIPHNQVDLKHIWYDTTAESGVWYKYRIEQKTPQQIWRVIQSEDPVMCFYEDMFLTDGFKQLKIQFNPNISEMKYNVSDVQQTTLGSKYPYVRRNGNSFYRTFSIGGLISALMDRNDWYDSMHYNSNFYTQQEWQESFTSPNEIYKNSKDLYTNFNSNYNISMYEDYIYERKFRQKVSDFLYTNNIKLFKSTTEGNILVRLMNISFQPVIQLGRRLYSFSATAIEIDEDSVKNYIKYDIINKNYHSYIGGIISGFFKSGQLIAQRIQDEQQNESLNFYELNIYLQNEIYDSLLFVKTIKDTKFFKCEVKTNEPFQITSQNNPIQNFYFYGVHLEQNQYSVDQNYYSNLTNISNPISNRVYYVAGDIGYIDNYISYNNYQDLLTSSQEEIFEILLDYGLFIEGEYIRYIYYNNEWHLFSENGDVLTGVNAVIQYYYQTQGVN